MTPPSASFIRWESSTESLVVDGAEALAANASGSYQYEVKLTDSKGAQATFTASIEFLIPETKQEDKPQTPLGFKQKLAEQVIPAGQNKRIFLPEFTGTGVISETVDLGDSSILTYDSKARAIFVAAKNEVDSQTVNVVLTLKDETGNSYTDTLSIKVVKVMTQISTQKRKSVEAELKILTAKLESVSPTGLAQIKFSEVIIPPDATRLNLIDEALKVEAFAYDDGTDGFTKVFAMKSKCVELKEQTMKLQLSFETPALVSVNTKPDRLSIRFVNERLFQTVESFVTIEPDYLIVGNIVPQYSSQVEAQVIEKTEQASKSGSIAIVVGLIAGQLAGKSVIKRIWSLFMALQIVVLVIDYELIQQPATALQVIKNIKGVITMEALNPQSLLDRYWPKVGAYLKNPDKILGNVNPQVLLAVGLTVAGIAVAAISMIAIKFRQLQQTKVYSLFLKFKAAILFNPLIASIQTSYLALWISTGTLAKTNFAGYQLHRQGRLLEGIKGKSMTSLVIDSCQIFAMSVFLSSVIAGVGYLIQTRTSTYFGREETKKKIGALYSNFDCSEKQKLHYATFFFVRRLYVALVLLYVKSCMLKVELISLSSYIAIYFCLTRQPFIETIDTKLEIFNEVCLLVANQLQIAFSDLLWDTPLLKIDFGWAYVALLTVLLSVNLFFLLKRTVIATIVSWLQKRRAISERLTELQSVNAGEIPVATIAGSQLVIQNDQQIQVVAKEVLRPQNATIVPQDQDSIIILLDSFRLTIKQPQEYLDEQVMSPSTIPKQTEQPCDVSSFDVTKPQYLRQGRKRWVSEGEYWLSYDMPRNHTWRQRAENQTTITAPSFIEPTKHALQQFMEEECQMHWLTPPQIKVLVDRFILATSDQPMPPDKQLDKQVIWIVEAGKQRRRDVLQNELAKLDRDWADRLAKRKADKSQIKENWQAKIKSNEEEQVGDLLPDMSPLFQKEELAKKFTEHCASMENQWALTRHWRDRMHPNIPLKNELDRKVAQAMLDIWKQRNRQVIDEGYKKEKQALATLWEAEDIKMIEEVASKKKAIEDIV